MWPWTPNHCKFCEETCIRQRGNFTCLLETTFLWLSIDFVHEASAEDRVLNSFWFLHCMLVLPLCCQWIWCPHLITSMVQPKYKPNWLLILVKLCNIACGHRIQVILLKIICISSGQSYWLILLLCCKYWTYRRCWQIDHHRGSYVVNIECDSGLAIFLFNSPCKLYLAKLFAL